MNQDSVAKIVVSQIPQVKPVEFSYIGVDGKAIDNWLTGLQGLTLATIHNQLSKTLSELVVADITEGLRLQLVQQVHQACARLIGLLHAQYLQQPKMLSDKELAVAYSVQYLYAKLLLVYRCIVVRGMTSVAAQPEKKSGFFGFSFKQPKEQKLVQTAIWRAMATLVDILFENKVIYIPVMTGLWENLHELYSLSESQHWLEDKISDSISNNQVSTLKQQYLRGILLGLVGTNELRRVDITAIYKNSLTWAGQMDCHRDKTNEQVFMTNLLVDAAPYSLIYATKHQNANRDILYIDTSALVKALADSLHESAGDVSEDSVIVQPIPDRLKHSLVNQLTEPKKRQHVRHPAAGDLQAVAGLTAVHYQVAGKRGFDQLIKIEKLGWQMIDQEIEQPTSVGQTLNQITQVDTKLLQSYTVSIINISPGGYRLHWTKLPSALQAGELIGIKNDSSEAWQVGVIRWVQSRPDKTAECGVEIIAKKATASGVRLNMHDGRPVHFMRALILPEAKAINRAATIITPSFHFNQQDKIKIRIGDKEAKARLGQQIMATGAFYQYDFILDAIKQKSDNQPT